MDTTMQTNLPYLSDMYVILDKSGGCSRIHERKGKCVFTPTFMFFIADGI